MKQQASTLKSTIISKLLHSMHSQAIEEAFFHSQDSYIIACQERGLFLFLFRHSPFLPPPPPPPPSFRSTLQAHTRTQLRLEGSSKRRPARECTPFHLTALIGRKYTCNRQGTDYGPQTNAASNYYNRPPLIIRLFSMSSSAVPRCSLYPPPPQLIIISFDRFLSGPAASFCLPHLYQSRRFFDTPYFSSPLSFSTRFFDSP